VQSTYGSAASNALPETQTNFFYNGADVLISYRTTGFEANGVTVRYTSHYYVFHRLADSYLAAGESVNTQSPEDPTSNGSIQRNYNVNNELISVIDGYNHAKNRYFANNSNGQAMLVVQGDLETPVEQQIAFNAALNGLSPGSNVHTQQFHFANGQNVGTVGQLQSGGPFITRANFDVNYTPLEQLAATTPAQVVVQEGDTLRSIAARIYGDEALWYLIADANGELNPSQELEVGRLLTIPNRVVSMANNAESFKPFNVEQIIGDLTPTQVAPPPPMKNGCGIVGMIIVFVVMIVVTYFTAGAAAGAMGGVVGSTTGATVAGVGSLTAGQAFAAAAIGAAAGSIASQGVAMALGMQDKFNWKAVLGSALTAGIVAGSGLNTMFGSNPSFGQMMVQGAAGSLINQGVNLALGLQKSFSWREVAISAVSSAVAGEMTQEIDSTVGQAVVGTISSTVVRTAMGGRVEASAVLADVFANVIGNGITDKIDRARASAKSMEDMSTRTAQRLTDEWLAGDSELAQQIRSIGTFEPTELSKNPSVADRLPESTASPDQVRDSEGAGLAAPLESTSAAEEPMQEIVVTGIRGSARNEPVRGRAGGSRVHGDALTVEQMFSTLERMSREPARKHAESIALYNAGSIAAVNSARGENVSMLPYGPGMKIADWEKREAFRQELAAADGMTPNSDADLIALFPGVMSKQERLEEAIRISGGYFSLATGENILEQINSGARAIDLTEARAENLVFLASLADEAGLRQTAWSEQLRYSVRDVTPMTIDYIVESRLWSWHEADPLLAPPRLDIDTESIQEIWDKAEMWANLGLAAADIAAAAPAMLARFGTRAALQLPENVLVRGLNAYSQEVEATIGARVIKAGDPDNIVLIGRSMRAVRPYADALRGQGKNVHLFDGPEISNAAAREFENYKAIFGNAIPDPVLRQTMMFKEIVKWIYSMRKSGFTIVDVGNPFGQGQSIFYNAELAAFGRRMN
jgi:LysM repeat protein